METSIKARATVNTKTIVNFKLLSFLSALTIVLHVVASAISMTHSFLSVFLTLVEAVGWIWIITIWIVALIKGIQQWGLSTWRKGWTYVRTHRRAKNAKKSDPFVPVAQLKSLRDAIQQLRLALHDMTPEMENARCRYFQTLSAAVPPLVLPSQNAILYAEFECLVKMLNYVGFPFLESVRLQQKDFAFLQQLTSDLEARLHQHQKHSVRQQTALRAALATVTQQHKTLGETCALAQNDSGYQRMQGALRFLENMVNDQRCPWDLAQISVQKLQSDMNTLMKQFEQAIL